MSGYDDNNNDYYEFLNGNDDGYQNAINAATDYPCRAEAQIINARVALPVGAIISVFCYLYIFFMYFAANSPILKRHPTSKSPMLYIYFSNFGNF